jgi:hypothetical protein
MRSSPILVGFLCALAGCGGSSQGNVQRGHTTSSSGRPAICDALHAEAGSELASAAAAADRSCATDADCVFFDGSPSCAIRCGGEVVSRSGAETLGGVVSHIERTVCTAACAETYPPCPPQPTWAACLEGLCSSFPAEAWDSLALELVNAEPGSGGIPLSCTGTGCTLWTVTPDGRVTIVRNGSTSTSTLSATDFALVDGALRSMDFRHWEASFYPRDCSGDTKAEPQLELALRTPSGEVGMNVTGCTLAGPGMAHVLAALVSVITAY